MDTSNSNLEFGINKLRFEYILELFNISKDELISRIHKGKKRKIIDIDSLNRILDGKEKMNIIVLKRIDKILKQGLSWYVTKRPLPDKRKSSIFFRKRIFNSELNLESRKKVNQYEELKFEIQALCNQINFDNRVLLKKYSISDNPETVSNHLKKKFADITKDLLKDKRIKKPRIGDDKEFLKNLIRVIEEMNIFVFEITENWNKKEKVNFDGFFIAPNIIVIKRQKYLRKEIFSLMHEFAHCLLNSEEIDEIDENEYVENSNNTETWCHNFAFFFLLGEHKPEYEKMTKAGLDNNFYEEEIDYLYNKTHLSFSSFYTRLRIENKISSYDYNSIIEKINRNIQRKEEENRIIRDHEKQLAKEQGKRVIAIQKPIESNLFRELVKMSYFQGKIEETKLRRLLKVRPNTRTEEVVF